MDFAIPDEIQRKRRVRRVCRARDRAARARAHLPRIVGLGRAQELVLSSRVTEAPEALAIGLVNRVVPGEQLLTAARETAALCAACDPDSLAIAKRALHQGACVGMAEAMENERAANAELRERKAKR